MTEAQALEALAKELHALLEGIAGIPTYEGEAPRDASEALAGRPPFMVYDAQPRGPEDEACEWTLDLFVDLWGLDSWAPCYAAMARLDDALDRAAFELECGALCADRSGLTFQRMERDPDDERIRRMRGQYLLRFNADLFKE